MGAAEHVRFADYAGSDADGGDCGVKFCMRGGEEELFEKTAALGDGKAVEEDA